MTAFLDENELEAFEPASQGFLYTFRRRRVIVAMKCDNRASDFPDQAQQLTAGSHGGGLGPHSVVDVTAQAYRTRGNIAIARIKGIGF
jgi:hypothetical protein